MEKLYIVVILVLGILIGFMLGSAYYKNQINKMKCVIDLLKLEIETKKDKNKGKNIIKG